tara:strand:- start:177 stop:956 length:780 start_codon:yes stop_codon:yes gene_type:complete
MILPYIDPIIFEIGPLAIRWYGLTWLIAILLIYGISRYRIRTVKKWDDDKLQEFIFYGLLGAILGGRIGYMVFYNINQLIADPLSIFYIWKGGLSFHGGLLGVLLFTYIFSKRKWESTFFESTDFIAPAIPLGLGSVRIGNFLNSELLGRSTDASWGVIYPNDPTGLIRHPSQLYQAATEGIILFIFLYWFSRSERPSKSISAMFLIGYGTLRFITEFFREPDPHIGYEYLDIFTRGQILCIPMILIGIMLLFISYKKV